MHDLAEHRLASLEEAEAGIPAQEIGAWPANLLVLLRCIQGLAMGGEWAGATVVTAELAPVDRRGYYGMYPQLGPALGSLLSSATFLLTTLTMSDAAFLSWGWRVPFLASAVLIVVGFVARMALEEPKSFRRTFEARTKRCGSFRSQNSSGSYQSVDWRQPAKYSGRAHRTSQAGR